MKPTTTTSTTTCPAVLAGPGNRGFQLESGAFTVALRYDYASATTDFSAQNQQIN